MQEMQFPKMSASGPMSYSDMLVFALTTPRPVRAFIVSESATMTFFKFQIALLTFVILIT